MSGSQCTAPLILDGGLGAYLERHPTLGDYIKGSPLWSTSLLIDNPQMVKAAHMAFFTAGAEAATTNTYQASVNGYLNCGYSVDKYKEALKVGLRVAAEARSEYILQMRSVDSNATELDQLTRPLKILRSCGNFGAYLNNMSEYTGEYPAGVTSTQIVDFHNQKLDILGRDLDEHEIICFETVPNKIESSLLPDIIRQFPECASKTWMSFSCGQGAKLRSGDSIVEVVQEIIERDRGFVSGIGFNCSTPQDSLEAIKAIATILTRSRPDITIFTYPNGLGQKEQFFQIIPNLLDNGVKAIGGCCGILPDDIAKLKSLVHKHTEKRYQPDCA